MRNTIRSFFSFALVLSAVINCTPDNKDNKQLLALLALVNQPTLAITTLKLSEGSKAANLILNQPEDLTIGDDGSIYVTDSKWHRIVKISQAGQVTEIVPITGNGGTVSVINNPEGITTGNNGILYVANTGASSATLGAFDGHNIITIDTKNNNAVELLSGVNRPTLRETIDGIIGTNRYYKPEGIRFANNRLIIGENGGFNAREANISNGSVSTLAGEKATGGSAPTGGTPATDGPGASAKFKSPKGVVADSKGNVFVADNGNNCIRKIDSANNVTTFAGSNLGGTDAAGYKDDLGLKARFDGPYMITIDEKDNLYVADAKNFAVRKITPAGLVTTIIGGIGQGRTDGNKVTAKLYNPIGINYDKKTKSLYITDKGLKNLNATDVTTDFSTIRKITNFQ